MAGKTGFEPFVPEVFPGKPGPAAAGSGPEGFLLVKEAHIVRLIERIGEHYRSNISNRFIRPALFQLPLDKQVWDQIETLTEKAEQFRYQGFQMDELYRQIAAAARFASFARRDLLPVLRNRLSAGGGGADKVLRDMAVNNFGSNLRLFADMVNELYEGLVELDERAAKGKRPLYLTMPELGDIGRLLAGS
jgi:hypothetical protein